MSLLARRRKLPPISVQPVRASVEGIATENSEPRSLVLRGASQDRRCRALYRPTERTTHAVERLRVIWIL
jgi:hypothetical protein